MKACIVMKVPERDTKIKLGRTYAKLLTADKRFVSTNGKIQFYAIYDGTGSNELDVRTEYAEGYTFLGAIVRDGKTIKVFGALS